MLLNPVSIVSVTRQPELHYPQIFRLMVQWLLIDFKIKRLNKFPLCYFFFSQNMSCSFCSELMHVWLLFGSRHVLAAVTPLPYCHKEVHRANACMLDAVIREGKQKHMIIIPDCCMKTIAGMAAAVLYTWDALSWTEALWLHSLRTRWWFLVLQWWNHTLKVWTDIEDVSFNTNDSKSLHSNGLYNQQIRVIPQLDSELRYR